MSEALLSVGLDVGTTTTQLILSRLTIENRASAFAVPELVIGERAVLYKSPVRFTPLLDEDHVDGARLRDLVAEEYRAAGISREAVDTGAIIITGETARKENAQAVLESLSDFAGEFVVATAGPDLESVLAAKGAGAVEYSRLTGRAVLHMDIGGGTSNLALIREGEILETGCLNVGGRLIKLDKDGVIAYVSPVLAGIFHQKVGEALDPAQGRALAKTLAQVLEMAAGLREPSDLLSHFITNRTVTPPEPGAVVSFSGGVADCIGEALPMYAFGDLGPLLGAAIRGSRLCRGSYVLGTETIRATVIGAGCHSAQLSGSTVFHRNVDFPLKNLPVAALPGAVTGEAIREALEKLDGEAAVLALPGIPDPGYRQVTALAEAMVRGFGELPVLVALEADMAKALGQALALRLPENRPILCLDRVRLTGGSYLDVAAPVGPALPVVIKTLILSN